MPANFYIERERTMTDIEVARMSDAARVAEGIKRGVGRLSPALQGQLQALVTPQALAVAASFFVAWLISHAIGIGFVVDAVFLSVGVVAVGLAVFAGIDELIQFGNGAIAARNLAQLDDAAKHFADGVSILGVQAVVALLLRRAPQTFRGRPLSVGPPPANAGFVLRPGLRSTRAMGPGEGATSSWGEITISRLGSATDRRLVALHEAVHRALTPRLDVLRFTRIEGRAKSYDRSSLSMYLEEALAESFAQVSVQGLRGLLTGIAFPVRYGYVSLFTKYALQDGVVMPVVPEIAGMFLGSINARGWIWDMYFSHAQPR
jgi:hypothetical protein